jgi:hypothetical protein
MHRFNARPVFCILYRKLLDDNIYKQLELVEVMVFRLIINFSKSVEVVPKRDGGKSVGWVKRYRGCWFLWPLCVFGFISVVVECVCVRDCKGLGLCIVGTVG